MAAPKEAIRALGVEAMFFVKSGDSQEYRYVIKSGHLPIKRRESGPNNQMIGANNRRGWVTEPGYQVYVWHRGKRFPFPPNPSIPTFVWAAERETSSAPAPSTALPKKV